MPKRLQRPTSHAPLRVDARSNDFQLWKERRTEPLMRKRVLSLDHHPVDGSKIREKDSSGLATLKKPDTSLPVGGISKEQYVENTSRQGSLSSYRPSGRLSSTAMTKSSLKRNEKSQGAIVNDDMLKPPTLDTAHGTNSANQVALDLIRTSSHRTAAKTSGRLDYLTRITTVSHTISEDLSGNAEKDKKLAILKETSNFKSAKLRRNLQRIPEQQTELTSSDNIFINQRAAQLVKNTSEEEMRNIVERMERGLRNHLAQKGIDPIIYHFRMCATREFRQRQAADGAMVGPQVGAQKPRKTIQQIMREAELAAQAQGQQQQAYPPPMGQPMDQQRPGINPQMQAQLSQWTNKLWQNMMTQAAQKYGGNVQMVPPQESAALQQEAQQRAPQLLVVPRIGGAVSADLLRIINRHL